MFGLKKVTIYFTIALYYVTCILLIEISYSFFVNVVVNSLPSVSECDANFVDI